MKLFFFECEVSLSLFQRKKDLRRLMILAGLDVIQGEHTLLAKSSFLSLRSLKILERANSTHLYL